MLRASIGARLAHVAMPLVIATVMLALFPSTASAIPAWSRRYSVPCSTCHYPAPPRLNAYGHKFRRAQFRLPEEFNKEADWKNLQNYVSFRIRARYEYDSNEGAGTVTSSFKLNDATLFYAGPVSKNFSGFVELERPGNEEIIEAVVAIGGIRGKPDSFWTFRAGQFHTLTRVGFGGLDRPTGISTPNALSRALVSGNAFALNQDQVGVEGTYVHDNWRIIGQILNGSNLSTGSPLSAPTTDQADQNRAKDALLAYEMMWGSTASGLTVFGYHGVQDDLTSLAAPDILTMKRFGVTAAQVFKSGFEVQGGYVKGTDDYDIPVAGVDSVDGDGYWVEVEKYFTKAKDLTLLGRYDFTDPDTDASDNNRKQITVGFVWPMADWHAKWAVELQSVTQQSGTGDQKDKKAVGELMLNF